MNTIKRRSFIIIIVSIFIILSNTPSLHAAQQEVSQLEVVLDENYPPYSFRDSKGDLQGITIDQWKLFEQKTGIKIILTGKPWNQAYESMLKGQFDVIDTISSNEERTEVFDFSKPYATIDVPIFFQKNISGINDVSSLNGFIVGVKKGDNCINVLRQNGINSIVEYDSAEAVMKAARDKEIVVFAIGKLPALYYMYKLGIQDDFHQSSSVLYTSQFYRAVKKGNVTLINTIDTGFAQISEAEYSDINKKWFGDSNSMIHNKTVLKVIGVLGITLLLLLLCLLLWNRMLTRMVLSRTQQLDDINTQLEQQNILLTAIFESSPDVVAFTLDRNYCYLNFNQKHKKSMLKIWGKEIEIGMNMLAEVIGSHEDSKKAKENFDRVLAGESFVLIEEYGDEEHHSRLFWQDHWSPIISNKGEVIGICCFVLNITEQKKTEMALMDREYLLRESQKVALIGSYSMELYSRKWKCSPELYQILGIPESYPHDGEALMRIAHPDWRKQLLDHLMDVELEMKRFDLEFKIVRMEDEEERWIHVLGELKFNPQGQPVELIGIAQDVTDRKLAEDKILYLSYRDQLTGLYNRRFYEEELRRLDVVKNYPLTIVMADVNGLKLINDSFGHASGDELLKKVAEVFKKNCRKNETIARLGGDEFILLLPRMNAQETEQLLQRIKLMASHEKVGSIEISISFGYETKNSSAQKIEEVLKKAEDHMYKKKLFESPSMRGKTIKAIINTLHEKNPREEQHSHRVSNLCQSMGMALGLSEVEVQELKTVGLLHDIGKVAIEEDILNKPGKLTEDEWEEIRRHPEIGYRILSTVNDMSEMADYVLAHHERWDGKGYPKGLQGIDIPLQPRIIAIAEAYDAMTSERSYRNALSTEVAIEELRKNAGIQFDPLFVEIFIDKVLKHKEMSDRNGI